ncbi:hypothetical protein FRB91_002089 [Serendipita sp. 411]|nr:hypothetical protein FRC18_007284 [Serendipita sp. 400]KAG8855482.1 hypothetical protein FRB91_002089 [Serendipita sp. 411]
MLALLSATKKVKERVIDAIDHLGVSQTDEDIALRTQLLSLKEETNFTVDTLTNPLGDGAPQSQPPTLEFPLVQKALQDVLTLWEDCVSMPDVESIHSSRLQLSNANRAMCRQLCDGWTVHPLPVYYDPPLLHPFAQKPFRIVAGDIPQTGFQGPISQIFKASITHEMRVLVELLLRSTEAQKHDSSSLLDRLLLLLWCDAAQSLQKCGSDLSDAHHRIGGQESSLASIEQLRTSVDQFDQGLRDSIVRRRRDTFSVALVGMEGCGKSSFLNYIIGRDLLLEEVGQATTYPCRIQHKPGQLTSELSLDAKYLNERLVLIRTKPIFQALIAVQWNGKSLLSDPDFGTEIRRWANFLRRDKTKESLAVIADPSFVLKDHFVGDKAVSTALQHTNHIVSICRLLDISFELFSDARWATLTVEFGEIGKLDKPYEILDLPGLYGNTHQAYWQDLVRESVRHAKAVVVMISASDVLSEKENAYVWRELPQMISSSTSVVPSAVILTQSDRLPVYPKQEQAARFKEVWMEFWPDATDTSPYKIYECSVLQGRSGRALVRAIESSEDLHVAALWDTHAYHALAVALNAGSLEDAEVLIKSVPLDQLKSSAIQTEKRGNMNQTTEGFLELSQKAANMETLREVQDISRRILQLLGLLRDILYELKSLSTEQLEALETQSKQEQYQMSILVEWVERESLLMRDYQCISKEAVETLDKRIGILGLDAAKKSREINDFSTFGLPSDQNGIYFLDEAAVDAFLASLRSRLMDLQTEVLASAEERIYSTKQEHFADLVKQAGQLNPTIEAPLLSSLSRNDIKSLLPEIKILDSVKDGLVTKQKFALRRPRGYKFAQERTLAWITGSEDHSIDKLSFLSRGFIGLAASFPYIMTLTLSRSSELATLYYINLDGLLAALKTIASTSWNDTVSQVLEKRLRDEAKRGRDLIGHALPFTAFDDPDVGTESHSSLDDSMKGIITAGYLNLIGALASQDIIVRGWSH